jgi:hypothetical protein
MLYTLSQSKLTLTYDSLILREFPSELVAGAEDKYTIVQEQQYRMVAIVRLRPEICV